MTNNDFHDWAIVSSSRNLGRSAFAAVIDKYREQGPWGVSVQVIPHCTAHAVAGTISLALDSHGPCIGAGGGPNGEIDSLFSAACILQQPDWFGAWIVFSGWEPELAIDTAGQPTSDSMCRPLPIAVTREWSACSMGRICFEPSCSRQAIALGETEHESLSASFAEFLSGADGVHRMWSNPAHERHSHSRRINRKQLVRIGYGGHSESLFQVSGKFTPHDCFVSLTQEIGRVRWKTNIQFGLPASALCRRSVATLPRFRRAYWLGKSAIRTVSGFDVSDHPCQIAGQLDVAELCF